MKNYLSILLTAVLLISMLALSGCNSNVTADVEYVKDQGKLVVGVIDAPPLTELNDEGEWTGLAADPAKNSASMSSSRRSTGLRWNIS